MTVVVVSPGRTRKLTTAVANRGKTLSTVPALAIVTAPVVRMMAFVVADCPSLYVRPGPKSQRFADTRRCIQVVSGAIRRKNSSTGGLIAAGIGFVARR